MAYDLAPYAESMRARHKVRRFRRHSNRRFHP
jgi:hypothetical protein